jgi:hypothetical protein
MIGDHSMLSISYDDPQSMAGLQECDVPPIRPAMGHQHIHHWRRKVVVSEVASGMMMTSAVARFQKEEQDGAMR